jgi:hypothetical protein
MKRVISAAISVLLLCGNVMSYESYKPYEFWNDTETVKKIFQVVVPEAQQLVSDKHIRYECAEYGYVDLAEEIANKIYPHIEKYMNDNGLTILTLKEFLDSIGIDTHGHDLSNTYKLLDYASTICEREVY